MAEVSAGNLYDLNKSLVAKYEISLRNEALAKKMNEVVIPYLEEKLASETYLMLLCNDQKDYTVFANTSNREQVATEMAKMLQECLLNRGKIFGIDRTEDQVALEIWIQKEDNEMYCYYFFPYTAAVLEF